MEGKLTNYRRHIQLSFSVRVVIGRGLLGRIEDEPSLKAKNGCMYINTLGVCLATADER